MPTPSVEHATSPDNTLDQLSRPAFGIVAALFCGYLSVGLPVPVLPLFVRDKLGFSNLIVGVVNWHPVSGDASYSRLRRPNDR
jgi:hypothetical protein